MPDGAAAPVTAPVDPHHPDPLVERLLHQLRELADQIEELQGRVEELEAMAGIGGH